MTSLTSRAIYAYLSGSWVDLSADALAYSVSGKWGIRGNKPADRTADTGEMRFTLSNRTGKYSPDGASPLSGWGWGVPVKIVLTYDGKTFTRFYGTIRNLNIITGDTLNDNYVEVTVLDWFDYASRQPIVNPGVLSNQSGDDVIRTALALMPIQPAATDLDSGINFFPTTFDVNTSKTTIYSEFASVAFSEFGYIYLEKTPAEGGRLVYENVHSRNGTRTLSPVPVVTTDSGFELREDGGFELREDGGKEILDITTAGAFTSAIDALGTEYGTRMLNYITLKAFPRRVDTSLVILFRLSKPILIGSGRTVTIKGGYSDPNGGASCNAQGLVTPVIYTDYDARQNEDGSGTIITADLSISAVFGSDGFTHTVTNTGATSGYIITYNIRGYGIYTYNPIENVASDAASITAYGYQTDTISQKYQVTLDAGAVETNAIVEREKSPRTVINRVSFFANRSSFLMYSFLSLDVGDLVQITNASAGVDGYFYIQSVEFNISAGGLIYFSWGVKEALTLTKGLSLEGVNFNQTGTTDALDFGYLPFLCNVAQRSVSFWIYMTADAPTFTGYNQAHIFGIFSDYSGFGIGNTNGRKIQYYQKGVTLPGIWNTPTNSIPLNTWCHVLVYRDHSSSTNAPSIYIDGVAQTLTNTTAQSGVTQDETSSHLLLGNISTATRVYDRYFKGKIQNARIYHAMLDGTHAAILNAAGRNDTTTLINDTLAFMGPIVRTSRLAAYNGTTLTSGYNVLDGIYGAVGSPHGTPVGYTP